MNALQCEQEGCERAHDDDRMARRRRDRQGWEGETNAASVARRRLPSARHRPRQFPPAPGHQPVRSDRTPRDVSERRPPLPHARTPLGAAAAPPPDQTEPGVLWGACCRRRRPPASRLASPSEHAQHGHKHRHCLDRHDLIRAEHRRWSTAAPGPALSCAPSTTAAAGGSASRQESRPSTCVNPHLAAASCFGTRGAPGKPCPIARVPRHLRRGCNALKRGRLRRLHCDTQFRARIAMGGVANQNRSYQ